jgi:hypothetical protein
LDEGAGRSIEVLVVFGEAPAAVNPGDGALDDPTLGQGFEALLAGRAFDDLDGPAGGVHGPAQFVAAIGAVGEDRLQEAEEPARPAVEDQTGAVAVLQVGRMNGDGKDQAEGIDEEMTLLAFDLLARVIARRVNVRPPFSALFTLWLSITPALGLASRPSRPRVIR